MKTIPDEISESIYVLLTLGKLSLLGSAYGASLCARAAVDALISVDYIYAITLSDSFNGTLSCACAATDAIFRNSVCHD